MKFLKQIDRYDIGIFLTWALGSLITGYVNVILGLSVSLFFGVLILHEYECLNEDFPLSDD